MSTQTIDDLLGFTGSLEEPAARPRNCLRRAQIHTLDDLVGKTADGLLAITYFDQKSLDYLNARLRQEELPEIGDEPYAL